MTEARSSSPLAAPVAPESRPAAEQELAHPWHEIQIHEADVELHLRALRQAREELERSREAYFELYELAPVGYVTVDARGNVLEANLMLATMLGFGRSRLLGTRFSLLLGSADRARFEEFVDAMPGSTPEKRTLEVALRRSDGTLVPVLLDACVDRTRGRSALRIAVLDVSSLRQAEDSARDRGNRLQAIFDAVADAITTVQWDGKIDSCNEAAARMFGAAPGRLVGRVANRVMPGFAKLVGKPRGELLAHHGDGTRFPVEVTVREIETGTKTKLVVVVTDITERKRRERELEEALTRFRQVADHLDDGVYVVERSSRATLYLSPPFEWIFGRTLEEIAREPWPRTRWVHDDDRESLARAVESIDETCSFDVSYRIVRPDGAIRRLRHRAFFVPQHGRVIGIVHDMTDELALQAELRQAQRLEAIGTLASGIAHDFNNLLMGVGGCAQLALRRLDPEHEAHGYLKRASEAILRGANLTRQILRFSDPRFASEAPVELDAVVAGARQLVHSLVGDRIGLFIVGGAPGLRVTADPGDIEQVLLNLASNARDAMPNGGSLTFRTEPLQGGRVALSVRDTGVGMNEETKRHVFEPFFTTKDVGKGTGLGLSTVLAVMKRLGGSVSVESVPGQGTTFSLCFPVVLQAGPEQPALVESDLEGQGQTILIVDDDALVRMTVETHVESLGYRALTASNVGEALRMYTEAEHQIDVVLTDVMMPGLLGSDLGRMLRRSAPNVSVIYMSAHPFHELVRHGHVPEHARLLAKPFGAPDLAAALRQALADRPALGPVKPLRVFVVDDDPDIVDTLKDVLELDGHEVAASNNARDALERIPAFAPDIVLCDINVDPSMNGFELVSRVRGDERLRRTVFLAVTGMPESQCRAPALAAGFRDVLTKPLDFDRLSRRLSGVAAGVAP